jgi:oligo-1,6-glucosidase
MGSVFGGSGWEWHEETQQYYLHIFSKKQPDLNWENKSVHKEVHEMMNFWIEKGIGGFRLDVIDLIGKEIDKGITGNGPRLHSLIQEMNRATFGDKDLLTVGETWDVTPEIAKLYSDPARDEFSMVFQFEHISLTWENGDKWNPIALDLKRFKQILNKWQTQLSTNGWNSLFWNNHDLPRVVSKYGDEGKYRVKSAKMLATAMHFLKGTPYIYQGEEIGMTNVKFDSLSDYRDIETLQFYDVKIAEGKSHQDMMEAIHENSRDNARTPMHWDSSNNAGFSSGVPWIKVNPNYTTVNVEADRKSSESIFEHYKQLITLRKNSPAMIYGDYIPLLEENENVFAYVRSHESQKIVVVCNFSAVEQSISLPSHLPLSDGRLLIANENTTLTHAMVLNPYQAFAIELHA